MRQSAEAQTGTDCVVSTIWLYQMLYIPKCQHLSYSSNTEVIFQIKNAYATHVSVHTLFSRTVKTRK